MVAGLLLIAIFVFVLICLGGNWIDTRLKKQEPRGDHTQRYAYDNLIEFDGVTYRQRKDLTTILLMGIDAEISNSTGQQYRNGGQADFLRLLVVDNAKKSVVQIQIDRDTMTPITVLGVLGNKSGIRTAQISLSHGFGDGREKSCELTAEAVSNLLFGVPVDFFVSMHLDGISTLNDLLGGVTLTLEDDFSALAPSMTSQTTLTLTGDQAEIYVRGRMNVGIGTNEARMARQERYINELINMLYKRLEKDEGFIEILYDALSPYLTTNMSRGRIINEIWTIKEYQRSAAIKPIGSHQIGLDGFMQFHADEQALRQMVLEVFYQKVK